MKSKFKLMFAAGVLSVGSFLLASAQQVAPNSLYIYSPDTNMGTTVYYGPKQNTINPSNVLGTTTAPVATVTPVVCVSYMTNFHHRGESGAEVVKLQNFLNQYNGAKLNGKGFYGPATEQEVRNLQYTYGIKVTGIQHEKTTALINSLNCGNIAPRARMTYTGAVSPVKVSVLSTSHINPKTIYPNPTQQNDFVGMTKGYTNTGKKVQNKQEGGLYSDMATETREVSSSTNSFWHNLKSDFQKIRDNYKAYVLVFVLVLALFWFLRKAATE